MINGGRAAQVLQPLVFLGERVLALTRGSDPVGTLVMPSGVSHPLRVMCTMRTWVEHQSVINREALAATLETEIRRQRLADSNDALDYVAGHLFPEFSGSFWDSIRLEPFAPQPASPPMVPTAEIVAQAPLPPSVAPALWIFGRVWLLATRSPEPGRMAVRVDGVTFGPTGRYVLFRSLDEAWMRQVSGYLERRVKEQRPNDGVTTEPALVEARRTFQRLGYWQGGDVLFIAGNPPWLAHVIPAHFSHTLGRQSLRDLALGVPWSNPPQISTLSAFAFEEGRGWSPFIPPHGICLGSNAPTAAHAAKLEPGLRVLSYLRWATGRVAENGHFHEYEMRSD